ncbi:hypothetical protein HN51_062898 [Arachis hypogaea]
MLHSPLLIKVATTATFRQRSSDLDLRGPKNSTILHDCCFGHTPKAPPCRKIRARHPNLYHLCDSPSLLSISLRKASNLQLVNHKE